MKKFKKVLALLVVLFLTVSLTGCGKKAITGADFKSKMEAKGYTVTDFTSSVGSAAGAKEALVANNKDTSLIVEFLTFEDEKAVIDGVEDLYNSAKDKEGTKSTTEVNLGNYNKRTVKVGEEYYVIERVDNTLLYIVSTKNTSKEADEIVKDLGY